MTYADLMKFYGIVEVSDGHYKTEDGRAYIEKYGNNDYRIFNRNGDYITFTGSLRLACVRASKVC